MARALLPSFSDGSPPMLMFTTSTCSSLTAKIIPSVSACAVHPLVKRQTRIETSFAPGAAPVALPKSVPPAMMLMTCVACAPETMPRLT